MPLVHNGWDGAKTSIRSPRVDNNRMFQGAMNADVVVFHRPDTEDKVQVVELLQKAGKKVVFDNDDTYQPNCGVPGVMKFRGSLEQLNQNIINFVKKADLVTTTTEFLADEYRKYNKNVVVIPNYIDPYDWPEPKENESNKVRVGLVGSTTLNGDFESIKPLLRELSKDKRVRLVILGLPPADCRYKLMNDLHKKEIKFWRGLNIEWFPLCPHEEYFETLNDLRLDFMLIPRGDTYFNRCKSNLKFLEAGILKIPVIAQKFPDGNSPYEKDINGQNGKLAGTLDEWRQSTELLIENEKLRKTLGENARKYVLKHFDINNHAQKWANAYKKICEK
jgi:glycosyltransferase involved in cell wall biosynthesis